MTNLNLSEEIIYYQVILEHSHDGCKLVTPNKETQKFLFETREEAKGFADGANHAAHYDPGTYPCYGLQLVKVTLVED